MKTGRRTTARPPRHPDSIAPVAREMGGVPAAATDDSDERLRAILQTAVEGIITIDGHGRMESANPAALRIFGYAPEEMIGQNVSMLMPEPDASRHDGYLDNYLRTGTAKIIGIGREVVGRRKDGSLFPMDLAVSEVRLSGARMFTGFVRDISERKRAESRQQFQLAITEALAGSDSVADAATNVLRAICTQLTWERGELWHHDAGAGVLRFVKSWQRRKTRYRTFETVTRHLTLAPSEGLAGDVLATRKPTWVPDIAKDRAFSRAKAAALEGFNSSIAFPVLLNDTVLAVMVFLGRGIRRPDEQLLQVLESVGSQLGQFIERKRAEETARREHAFSSAILATTSALVVVLDREGRVVRFNPACELITGYQLEEVRGRHFTELFLPPEEREAVQQVFADLSSGLFPNRHENHWITRHGERRWIAWSNSAIVGEDGEVEYVIGTGIDLTDQKRLEREILAISDLEQRRIGHDLHDGLCQQLAGIEFMSQALQQRIAETSPPDAESVGQISALVRQAITQTRDLAHGLSPVMREAGGLMAALQSLALNTSHLFRVTCRFICPVPVPVANDNAATHAYRIAQEAVSNALRHGHAKRVLVRLESDGSHAVVTVRDNGVGLLHGSKPGSGMGLEIMRYRAAMIGGKVDLLTKPGRGVTVVCQFPNPVATARKPRRKR